MAQWDRRRFLGGAGISRRQRADRMDALRSGRCVGAGPRSPASRRRSSTRSKSAARRPSRWSESCRARSACTCCRTTPASSTASAARSMKRIARREDTGDVHELATFTGNTGAAMPRHAHLSSHAALLVMRGEIELELDAERWTMMRGDFANLPPGTAHGWTMRSDGAQLALFTMNHRVGPAFVAMGARQNDATIPAGRAARDSPRPRWPVPLWPAISSSRRRRLPPGSAVRVSNKQLPVAPAPTCSPMAAVSASAATPSWRATRTLTGQFLFIITEGGPGGGVGAHFHARHFENFFGSTARRSAGPTARRCRCARATTFRRRRAICTAFA